MMIDSTLLKASWRSWYANDLRVVGPPWLQLLWTFVFSTVVGICFFLLGMGMTIMGSGRLPSWGGAGKWLLANLLVSWTIGACIHALFGMLVPAIGVHRIRAFSQRQKALFFSGIPIAGSLMGWPAGTWLASGLFTKGWWFPFQKAESVVGAFLLVVLISFLFYKHFDAKAREILAERRAMQAQLRLLQAQIEPHFLFNTLANVQALIDHDAARAKAMLEAFTDYLRASLGDMRRDEAPLADELALAEAYLRVQQTRMEDRLHFQVEANAACREALLPPLLLQPLVENAVQHGLEPQVSGGTVSIKARIEGQNLVLDVLDDGQGLAAAERKLAGHRAGKGAGVAINNIRERLSACYGPEATVSLSTQSKGTLARLTLPLNRTAFT